MVNIHIIKSHKVFFQWGFGVLGFWGFGVPAAAEREEILRIHLRARGREPAQFDVAGLARLTEGFSGAELEQAVVSGLYLAFHIRAELDTQHLTAAVRETFPLSTTMADENRAAARLGQEPHPAGLGRAGRGGGAAADAVWLTMGERRNRFLNLEGARPATPATTPPVSSRFGDAAGPPPGAPTGEAGGDPGARQNTREASNSDPARNTREASDSGGSAAAATPQARGDLDDPLAQLKEQRRAQLESGLALDYGSDDEQPFVRCGQCETDSARGTRRCKTCGQDLDTPLQRAFNQHLWEERKKQREQERAELEAQAKEQPRELSPAAQESAQREFGELLARQVRERESQRLGWMDGGDGVFNRRPLGLRLLDLIPSPLWRFVTSIALLIVACLLGWRTLTTPRGEGNPLVQLGFFALLFLFLPLGRRRGIGRFGRW